MCWLLTLLLLSLGCSGSGTGEVVTLAGSGREGYADGSGSTAAFNGPLAIAFDDAGDLYVADTLNNRIRKVLPSGEVSTLAGGERGHADGVGVETRFYMPAGLAFDGRGGLYVGDSQNHVIRYIELSTATVTTVAGLPGRAGFVNGSLSAAQFDRPNGVDMEPGTGRLWVVDKGNDAIRIVDLSAGSVETIAGGGEPGADDGVGAGARFLGPTGITLSDGGAWVTDTGNHTIRHVDVEGRVTTVAGVALHGGYFDGAGVVSRLNWPWGISRSATGAIVFADLDNGIIRALVSGVVRHVAGQVQAGPPRRDGPARQAVLAFPSDVAVEPSGEIYFVDRHSVRIIRGIEL